MKKYHIEDIIPVGTMVMVSPNIISNENDLFITDEMLQLGRDRFIGRVVWFCLFEHLYRIYGSSFYWKREWLIPCNELTLYDLI